MLTRDKNLFVSEIATNVIRNADMFIGFFRCPLGMIPSQRPVAAGVNEIAIVFRHGDGRNDG